MTAVVDISGYREPPHNADAEQVVIGSVLINNDIFHDVSDLIGPDDFYFPEHAEIWREIEVLSDTGRKISPVLMSFKDKPYLAKLAATGATVLEAREYAKTVHDLGTRRELIASLQTVLEAARGAPHQTEAEDIISQAEKELAGLDSRTGDTFKSFADAARGVLEQYQKAAGAPDGIPGIRTGLADIDQETGGLMAPDMIVLAARPSMGKTAMAMNFSIAASKQGPVLFFSLEMSAEQLAGRVMAANAEIDNRDLRRGREIEAGRLTKARDSVSGLDIFIDDRGGQDIETLCATARRINRRTPLALVVVDYLQLLKTRDRQQNRVQEIATITGALKALAKQINAPVLVLSQLSREVERRENKRPIMADLRDSGTIEQDADIVAFLYRKEYYLEREARQQGDPDYSDWLQALHDCKGHAEFILGKNRNGRAPHTIHLLYNSARTQFHSLARGL